ncbi:MAG: dolichyl-phosphate-mannose--protein mannosyltransferase [Actinomycetota bacterium]
MPLARFLGRPMVALAIVAAFAGGLRFYNLGHPAERVFDEVYYSKDGCLYAGYSVKECGIKKDDYWVVQRADDRGETSWVHPQLGKWAIAAGILGEGNDPFGWRVSSAAAGTATVVITAAIAWLVFGSVAWAYVAGLLLATENLNFVQSRISMLDIFLAFWVVLGFLFLVLDRRWIDRRAPGPEPPPDAFEHPTVPALSPGPGAMAADEVALAAPPLPEPAVPSPIWRPWRFAAGFAFGAACATKWSAGTLLLSVIVLAVAWEVGRRRRAGERAPLWAAVRSELLGIVLAFVLVPIAVYLISYTRYFVFQTWHPGTFLQMQRDALDFHSGLHYLNEAGDKAHPYESKPWTWIAMIRPVSYYYASPGGERTAAEVLAMGNPLLFWSSIVTIPVVTWHWLRRRSWVAGLIAVGVLAQYLPWFGAASRVQFLFYITPVTPFLVLGAVYVLRELWDWGDRRGLVGAAGPAYVGMYVATYVGLFAFFYPILTGWQLSYHAWHLRMWMNSWI